MSKKRRDSVASLYGYVWDDVCDYGDGGETRQKLLQDMRIYSTVSAGKRSTRLLNLDDLVVRRAVRIGTQSKSGIVYRVALKGTTSLVALKLLPSETEENNEKEIRIALELGQKAAIDSKLPFIIALGGGRVGRRGTRHLPPIVESRKRTYSHYLISELAAGDLQQVNREVRYVTGDAAEYDIAKLSAKKRAELKRFSGLEDFIGRFCKECPKGVSTYAEWMSYAKQQAICAVRALHDFGYSHNDIHWANFLMLRGSGKVVIHDFDQALTESVGMGIQEDYLRIEKMLLGEQNQPLTYHHERDVKSPAYYDHIDMSTSESSLPDDYYDRFL